MFRWRYHLLVLSAWYTLLLAVHAHRFGYSWRFFALGGQLVTGHTPTGDPAGGLHLYANYPQLQIGPLSLLVAAPFARAGQLGELAAIALMAAAGPLLLYLVARRAPRRITARRLRLTAVSAVFLALWVEVAVYYAHLDDALVIAFAIAAVLAVRDGRHTMAAVWLGLAVAAKPWALVFVPLLLVPATRAGLIETVRRRWRAAAIVAVVGAVAWLPFLLADPGTLAAGSFTIGTADASTLRALGVHAARTPIWDRPAQLALALGLGVIAVRRHRWAAVLALGVVARMLLDPGAYNYYTAGLAAGALVWDVLAAASPVPWASLITFAGLYLPALLPGAGHSSWLPVVRLLGLISVAVVVLALPARAPVALSRPARDRVPLMDLRDAVGHGGTELDEDDVQSLRRA